MKVVIQENRAYRLYAEITDILAPKGHKYLKLTSTYEGSRIPNEERKVFEGTFTPDELQEFVKVLSSG